jgi:MOSC domain-containing protein YiiM
MNSPRLVSIHVGTAVPLGPDAVQSAFVKHVVDGPVAVGALGLTGDQQADLSVHGGPEKAVYAYAAQHYAAWREEFPQHSELWGPGSVGENLAIAGMTEADIHVGDVHAIGTALLQVCQPRQPCFKFSLRFDNSRLPKAMVKSGRSGWYYRVLRPGLIAAGDSVLLGERPNPEFPFTRLVALVNRGAATRADLERMIVTPGLASQWRDWARETLLKQG